MLIPPQVQIRSDELGIDQCERWSPSDAAMRTVIKNGRTALDSVRYHHQAYFSLIDPMDLAKRLANFHPQEDWGAQNNQVSADYAVSMAARISQPATASTCIPWIYICCI